MLAQGVQKPTQITVFIRETSGVQSLEVTGADTGKDVKAKILKEMKIQPGKCIINGFPPRELLDEPTLVEQRVAHGSRIIVEADPLPASAVAAKAAEAEDGRVAVAALVAEAETARKEMVREINRIFTSGKLYELYKLPYQFKRVRSTQQQRGHLSVTKGEIEVKYMVHYADKVHRGAYGVLYKIEDPANIGKIFTNVVIKGYELAKTKLDFEDIISNFFALLPDFSEPMMWTDHGIKNCGIMQSYNPPGRHGFTILESVQPEAVSTSVSEGIEVKSLQQFLVESGTPPKGIYFLKIMAQCISQFICLSEYGILNADFKAQNTVVNVVDGEFERLFMIDLGGMGIHTPTLHAKLVEANIDLAKVGEFIDRALSEADTELMAIAPSPPRQSDVDRLKEIKESIREEFMEGHSDNFIVEGGIRILGGPPLRRVIINTIPIPFLEMFNVNPHATRGVNLAMINNQTHNKLDMLYLVHIFFISVIAGMMLYGKLCVNSEEEQSWSVGFLKGRINNRNYYLAHTPYSEGQSIVHENIDSMFKEHEGVSSETVEKMKAVADKLLCVFTLTLKGIQNYETVKNHYITQFTVPGAGAPTIQEVLTKQLRLVESITREDGMPMCHGW